ncbi:F-box protein CPR1-like [Salvia hispanica]|uniref:F-box protein CPR1-like n=1 Tax=Salvia hispanica TaxID=49212 RepID=UPI0020097D3A|nr:F-box protein CPR1-like [Salvia hispanica]
MAQSDRVDLEIHDLHYHPLTDLVIPHPNRSPMEGTTANDLLLLYPSITKGIPLYICNPMTREYAELSYPLYIPERELKFGFGVSKLSGEYKVVCINADNGFNTHYVYTLGIGKWRRIEAGAASGYKFWTEPLLCNHNLHWAVIDLWYNNSICGFDVETERFSVFSFPANGYGYGDLCVLRDHLCYCYTFDDDFIIWMMKEYQVEESWTIEYKLGPIICDFDWDFMLVEPFKVFKDGDILMLLDKGRFIYYSNKTGTFEFVDMFKDLEATDFVTPLILNPSLNSLKNFGFKNVISL